MLIVLTRGYHLVISLLVLAFGGLHWYKCVIIKSGCLNSNFKFKCSTETDKPPTPPPVVRGLDPHVHWQVMPEPGGYSHHFFPNLSKGNQRFSNFQI